MATRKKKARTTRAKKPRSTKKRTVSTTPAKPRKRRRKKSTASKAKTRRKVATSARSLPAAPARRRRKQGSSPAASSTRKVLEAGAAIGLGATAGAIAGPAIAGAIGRRVSAIGSRPLATTAIAAAIPVGAGLALRKKAPLVSGGMIGIGVSLLLLAAIRAVRDRVPALAALDLGPLASPRLAFDPVSGRLYLPTASGEPIGLTRAETDRIVGAMPETTLRLTDGRAVRGAVLGQDGGSAFVYDRRGRRTVKVPLAGVVNAPHTMRGIVPVLPGARPLAGPVPRPAAPGTMRRPSPSGLSTLSGPVSLVGGSTGCGY